jgi:hypothetical protein
MESRKIALPSYLATEKPFKALLKQLTDTGITSRGGCVNFKR